MFLTIKRSNISERLTPLIMPSECPCRGTALPCPDGCREAIPEAPKSHFLKGGLSACKRYPFGLQKTTFLRAKRRPFVKSRKTALCNGSSLPSKNAATIPAEISDGKKSQNGISRGSICPQQQNATQRAKKTEVRTKKTTARTCAGKAAKRRRRKNHAAAQPENKAAATPCRTHIIYIAHNAPKTANKR